MGGARVKCCEIDADNVTDVWPVVDIEAPRRASTSSQVIRADDAFQMRSRSKVSLPILLLRAKFNHVDPLVDADEGREKVHQGGITRS